MAAEPTFGGCRQTKISDNYEKTTPSSPLPLKHTNKLPPSCVIFLILNLDMLSNSIKANPLRVRLDEFVGSPVSRDDQDSGSIVFVLAVVVQVGSLFARGIWRAKL